MKNSRLYLWFGIVFAFFCTYFYFTGKGIENATVYSGLTSIILFMKSDTARILESIEGGGE